MPIHTHLHFLPSLNISDEAQTFVVIGRKGSLRQSDLHDRLGVPEQSWTAILERTSPGNAGASSSTWVGDKKVIISVLPEACSRYNSPSRAWAIPGLARKAAGKRSVALYLVVDKDEHALASVMAASRSFPLYSATSGSPKERTATITVIGPNGLIDIPNAQARMEGVRTACCLVDQPTSDLHTDAFVAKALNIAQDLGVETTVVRGTDLRDQGFGGLWGVGKAAIHLPAFVALHYKPEGATQSVAWVGKGIVYDTGGLSLKTKTGMVGMKGDMGGAAAVLGAFQAAVTEKVDYGITAILCLAENAIGPEATRPDDVLHMKSGKTVEVNNTDAEGRLVLADGVAWAAKHANADLIVDIATLTGAALVSTGRNHAALYCNDPSVEKAAVEAGRSIGEPCHPLIYAPELFADEFKSSLADMKNSVKDRANAQSSCAGQFIGNHLPKPTPKWLHIDIAGPAWSKTKMGTGYGVGLLVELGAGPA